MVPAAAFVAGAILGGTINNQPPASGGGHVDWCDDRYRSYRASDNTFQPYNATTAHASGATRHTAKTSLLNSSGRDGADFSSGVRMREARLTSLLRKSNLSKQLLIRGASRILPLRNNGERTSVMTKTALRARRPPVGGGYCLG
jgi:hypothetical protein